MPFGDLTDGYIVGPDEWNGNFNSIVTYLNTTIKAAVDALQTGGIPVVGAQGTFQARLSLESGVVVSSTDKIGLGTLYLEPKSGGQIGLWSGLAWTLETMATAASISLSTIKKWVHYDVFAYTTLGVITLELVEWKSVVASNSPGAGSNVTFNVADTTGVAVGDWVTIRTTSGPTTELCLVNLVTLNTSIRVTTTGSAHTLPTIYYPTTRATALSQQNSVYVKSTQTNKRYVGTIRGSGDGVTSDSGGQRFVWNLEQQAVRPLLGKDSTGSWNYSTAVLRAANATLTPGTGGRAEFVVGLSGRSSAQAEYFASASTAAISSCSGGIGYDSILLASEVAISTSASAGYSLAMSARIQNTPLIGFHFFTGMEAGGGGATDTWYGGGSGRSSYLTGSVAA